MKSRRGGFFAVADRVVPWILIAAAAALVIKIVYGDDVSWQALRTWWAGSLSG
jgi:hypothetical protein